jgi:hypothetical protein
MPQQNGVVERRNRTVVEMARCLLKSKNMPREFWGEAISTAVYILDRAPTKSLQGKTPYEALSRPVAAGNRRDVRRSNTESRWR